MNWLLIFFPIAIGLEIFAPDRHLLVFAASSLAILPLAGVDGPGHGTACGADGRRDWRASKCHFWQCRRLIIALVALRAGLHDVVKASIAGSIVGNILLVLGAAMLAGGLRHSEQHFNAAGERVRFQVRSPMSANDP
jgi:Ca2+:H+ antiporter